MTHEGDVKFEFPHPGCREPCGLLATRRWSPWTGLTYRLSWWPSLP